MKKRSSTQAIEAGYLSVHFIGGTLFGPMEPWLPQAYSTRGGYEAMRARHEDSTPKVQLKEALHHLGYGQAWRNHYTHEIMIGYDESIGESTRAPAIKVRQR